MGGPFNLSNERGTILTRTEVVVCPLLRLWFAATERYARQLHEMDREAYLGMKRVEYARQQTLQ